MKKRIGLISGYVLEIVFATAIILVSIPLWIGFTTNGYSYEASENSQNPNIIKNN